jgi:hypothetical protein
MAITPLFTTAELDTQIAAYKQALLDLAGGKSVRLATSGGSDRLWTSEDVVELRNTLEWLQNERVKLSVGSAPQFLPGRPRR